MKAFLIIAFICFVSASANGQERDIVWNENKPLQWFDFTGPVNDQSHFDAESFAEVKFSYKFNSPADFYFEVYANFNKKTSWCKKEYQSEALLKHEQLHFDIAGLYSKRLKEAFENYHYSKDYKNEIERIFNQKKSEYHQMQKQYDEETNHSLNKERQNDWEKFISDQLRASKFKLSFVKQ